MAKATATAEDLLGEAVRLLQCLTAREMARVGVTQQAIALFLKTAKADVRPMVQGIKRAKVESSAKRNQTTCRKK